MTNYRHDSRRLYELPTTTNQRCVNKQLNGSTSNNNNNNNSKDNDDDSYIPKDFFSNMSINEHVHHQSLYTIMNCTLPMIHQCILVLLFFTIQYYQQIQQQQSSSSSSSWIHTNSNNNHNNNYTLSFSFLLILVISLIMNFSQFIILSLFVYSMSPVIQSLTSTFSHDTIYVTSCLFFLIHLISFDYEYFIPPQIQSTSTSTTTTTTTTTTTNTSTNNNKDHHTTTTTTNMNTNQSNNHSNAISMLAPSPMTPMTPVTSLPISQDVFSSFNNHNNNKQRRRRLPLLSSLTSSSSSSTHTINQNSDNNNNNNNISSKSKEKQQQQQQQQNHPTKDNNNHTTNTVIVGSPSSSSSASLDEQPLNGALSIGCLFIPLILMGSMNNRHTTMMSHSMEFYHLFLYVHLLFLGILPLRRFMYRLTMDYPWFSFIQWSLVAMVLYHTRHWLFITSSSTTTTTASTTTDNTVVEMMIMKSCWIMILLLLFGALFYWYVHRYHKKLISGPWDEAKLHFDSSVMQSQMTMTS